MQWENIQMFQFKSEPMPSWPCQSQNEFLNWNGIKIFLRNIQHRELWRYAMFYMIKQLVLKSFNTCLVVTIWTIIPSWRLRTRFIVLIIAKVTSWLMSKIVNKKLCSSRSIMIQPQQFWLWYRNRRKQIPDVNTSFCMHVSECLSW